MRLPHLCILVVGTALLAFEARADLHQDGLRALRRGDARRAVVLFRQALSENADQPDVAQRLAQALLRLGQREESAMAYKRAIELAPDRWQPYAGLAELRADDARRFEVRDETLKLLGQGLERCKKDTAGKIHLSLAVAHYEFAVGRSRAALDRLRPLGQGGEVLSAEQKRRKSQLMERIQTEQRARTLIDWPEPKVPDAALGALRRAEESLDKGQTATSRAEAERLRDTYPGWRAPRFLLARVLSEAGQYDAAEYELSVLTRLAPSHAAAWRFLGRMLAEHGGTDRADEALRHALALDPAFVDLWLLRAQVALRRGSAEEAGRLLGRYLKETHFSTTEEPAVLRLRAALQQVRTAPSARRTGQPAEPPTEKAREKFREARDWQNSGDTLDMARDWLREALSESPGYVDAAALYFELTGQVEDRTIKALWEDGDSLYELSRRVRASRNNAETRTLVRPWLDQAVRLGVSAARQERGLLRIDENDRAGGIIDLTHYVATEPSQEGLDEALAVLESNTGDAAGRDPLRILARVKLLADRPREAVEVLGGGCSRQTPSERLIGLGLCFEWAGELQQAVFCYREALARTPSAHEPLERLAGIGARADLALMSTLEAELAQAAGRKVAQAEWALARLALAKQDSTRALVRLDRYLSSAVPDDLYVRPAREAQGRILAERENEKRQAQRKDLLLSGGGLGALGILLLLWFRGSSLARALSRRPSLFPEVARTISELRHDVLKHRTSVLGLIEPASQGEEQDPSVWEEIARMLWEPRRASDLVAGAYDGIRQVGKGRGMTLCRLSREPIFGPLYRDLRRAEALVRRPSSESASDLLAIDRRLSSLHAEKLGGLLRLGPRTRLDAGTVSTWIRSVEGAVRLHGDRWTSPELHLSGLDVEFPVERAALEAIFMNLLRNAQVAAKAEPVSRVSVRIEDERDATGRRQVVLLCSDTARRTLTMETIEGRESGRGLAIVRDLVHEWRGHLVIRQETSPFTKAVGACFPGPS